MVNTKLQGFQLRLLCLLGTLAIPSLFLGLSNCGDKPSDGAATDTLSNVHDTSHTVASDTTPRIGPKINASAIPVGAVGSAVRLLKTTTEKPGASDGSGAFRTVCQYSHMNWDDPLVYPGLKGASHLHTFFGNSLTDAFSTDSSLRNTGNSTCRGGIVNRTAYWVPALIDANGNPQKPHHGNFYYKSGFNGEATKSVKPFPQGLRMIAGRPKATSPEEMDHAWWDCVPGDTKHPPSIPECGQDSMLVMTVEFPQCWDGIHLDSPDHRSHMAYPTANACPPSHPVAIPHITFSIDYRTPAGGMKGWHLSSDMYDTRLPGGYSAHGDWFEAWDPEIVKTFVENCDNPAVDCHSSLLGDGREIEDPPQ